MFPPKIGEIELHITINEILIFLGYFRDLSNYLGGAYAIQYFFAAVSVIGFFFGLIFLPETHGKKLSDIETFFESKKKLKLPIRTKSTNAAPSNRKPKQTLETVKESEKMIKTSEEV